MTYYFFNDGSGDVDWGTVNNWWSDAAHTVPLGFVPTPGVGDTLYIDSSIDTGYPGNWDFDVFINSSFTSTSDFNIKSITTVTVDGTFNCSSNVDIFNTYSLINFGSIIVNGALTNNGTFTNNESFTLNNSFTSNGIFTNNNFFTSITSPAFQGISENTGTMNLNFGINNTGTFNNNGTINLLAGTLLNSNTINNYTLLNISNSSMACFAPLAMLRNYGTFIFGTRYTTTIQGEIFPQIPSSRAFGTGLLGNIF